MEKRLILAIVLSFLILFLFQLIFVKPQPQPAAPVPAESEAETAAVGNEAAGGEIKEVEKPASMQLKTEGGEIITSEQEQEITIDTPLYTAVWSNKGGVLRSWKLKN
nr:membrane protein insertase YidC [Candidatus Saccharicenans sp.]